MAELNTLIGCTFVKNRHNIKRVAVLRNVGKKKVELQCPDREDSFHVSLKEFSKFWVLQG
jgi:hypothetical protein